LFDVKNYVANHNQIVNKKDDGRINRHHLGVILWRLGVAITLLFILLLLARTLISITTIIIFMIGLTILSFIFLITLGTILIIDPQHSRHWKNLIDILASREQAMALIDKIVTYTPFISATIFSVTILALILLYTSKLPVRRFRFVSAIFIVVFALVTLIYTLVGGTA